jgi:hypothetical protein
MPALTCCRGGLERAGEAPPHNASITVRACISASYSVPRRNILLLISIAYHRRYGRAVWIDPVVLRAITISRNNIIIPGRSCPYHGHPDDKPLPWFTNDIGLPRMRCGTKRRQVTQDQCRSERYGHYPHASASLPQRQINEHLLISFQLDLDAISDRVQTTLQFARSNLATPLGGKG